MANARQQVIINSLSPPERLQLADLLEYLGEKATDNRGGYMPEGSVASLLNKQTPRIQAAIKAIDMFAETPRFAPFEPKLGEAERFVELGFDPQASVTIKAALDCQYVQGALEERLGRDEPDDSPPTTREVMSEAFDLHTQGANDG